MLTVFSRVLAAVVALSTATACEAAWQRASSAHFVIYADENASDLRAFAEKLERFDKAVRLVRRMDDPPVGDGNRLTVFVVRGDRDVQGLIHDSTGTVRGFYIPRATGSIAIVPAKSGSGRDYDLDADTVFFHEYSHHLMMQDLDAPYPPWLIEGFAELMSTAAFDEDGTVVLGLGAKHRAYSLMMGVKMPIERILSGELPNRGSADHESLYARGWALTHYLTFEPSRKGQLVAYINGMANGTPPLQSARAAFGDLKQLDKDLDAYVNRPKLLTLRVSGSGLQPGPIEIQALSPGAAAVLPLRIQSKRGTNAQNAEQLAVKVRAVESRYPGDELVERSLAEAEFDARHAEASEAAADRALKANPRSTEAMVYKGRAIMMRAQNFQGTARSAAFEQARQLFIAANKIDTEDPQPLMWFYRTYPLEGVRPTANAIAALHYASNLAPQDRALRMNSAAQFLRDGKLKEAKQTLQPIAYDPHGEAMTAVARLMMQRIDAGDVKGAISAPPADAPSTASSPAN